MEQTKCKNPLKLQKATARLSFFITPNAVIDGGVNFEGNNIFGSVIISIKHGGVSFNKRDPATPAPASTGEDETQ
jgi:hypothetical protein